MNLHAGRSSARPDPRFVPALRGPNEGGSISQEADPATMAAAAPKVGRNEPCPSGSGNKYKLCHGRLA